VTTASRPHIEVPQPAFLFDLDGTLVDSVYQHVIAWQEALAECGVPLSELSGIPLNSD
jgi:beta-phosphoglucomutase-like phosphatase (HAD superfamily)